MEYVRPSKSPRILENDTITVWGSFRGLMTYTTIMGAQITIPKVNASFIENSNLYMWEGREKILK